MERAKEEGGEGEGDVGLRIVNIDREREKERERERERERGYGAGDSICGRDAKPQSHVLGIGLRSDVVRLPRARVLSLSLSLLPSLLPSPYLSNLTKSRRTSLFVEILDGRSSGEGRGGGSHD